MGQLGYKGLWLLGAGGGGDTLSVDFTADDTNPSPSTSVTFTGTGDVGSGYYHVWSWGDGDEDLIEDTATAAHAYSAEGVYDVVLYSINKTADTYGYKRRDSYISAEASYSPVLDNMSATANFAWSVYQPSSAQTNSVRMRESGGDTEANIAYDANGLLDTSSATAFLSGNSGYMVIAKDGTGGGNDATESAAASQLLYNSSGTLGYPCFNVSSTNASSYPLDSAITNSGPFHGFFLMRLTGNTGADIVLAIDNANDAWGYMRYRPDVTSQTYLGMAQGAGSALYNYGSVQPTGTYLVEVRRDASNNVEVSLNNGTQQSAGTFSNTNSINQLIGTISAGNTFELYEIYLFDTELSAGDRTTYINHINDDYGLSL